MTDRIFLYTDGSSYNGVVGLGISYENKPILKFYLHHYSSILSAEIIAILSAIEIAKKDKKRYAICTDSLASIEAILNVRNTDFYPTQIRENILKLAPKIVLIWIPGHVNIAGNELADQTAKSATKDPIFMTPNLNINDITQFLKNKFLSNSRRELINKASNWYIRNSLYDNNSFLKMDHNGAGLSRRDLVKIVRIRLGHTSLTHRHIFDKTDQPTCQFCPNSIPLNLDHIIFFCPNLNNLRSRLLNVDKIKRNLKNPSVEFMKSLILFLQKSQLYSDI